MHNLKISKMTKEDLQGIYDVEKESFPIPWPISSFEKELSNMLATYLVAKIDEEIIGYIGAWFVMDECHVMNVAVKEKYRGNKIATKLVNELFKNCKNHGTKHILLEVRKNNIAAQKLYQHFGFKEEVIRKGYYKNPDNTYEDAIVMGKEI